MRLRVQFQAQTSLMLPVTGTQRENDNHRDHEHHQPEQVACNPIRTIQTPLLTHGTPYLENVVQLQRYRRQL
jgi:hypothetical protein